MLCCCHCTYSAKHLSACTARLSLRRALPQSTSDLVLARLQRVLLWERRNNNVPPFNETVQQVFSRISALRDSLDGPQVYERSTTGFPFKGRLPLVIICRSNSSAPQRVRINHSN